jgi:hypothetical protein
VAAETSSTSRRSTALAPRWSWWTDLSRHARHRRRDRPHPAA